MKSPTWLLEALLGGVLALPGRAAAATPADIGQLLEDLGRLEALNSGRQDAALRQRVQHQIAAARRQLQRAAQGAMAPPLALTGLLSSLQAMALHNQRERRDPALGRRFAEEADTLRLRTERLVVAAGPPYPSYGLSPALPETVLVPRRGVVVAARGLLPTPPFAALLQQMQRLAFGDEKIRLARDAAQVGVRLGCGQIAELMRTTSFGDEQVEIAAALYPLALDPGGLGILLGALAHESDRERLRQRLGLR